jgi:hypothetical protein
MDKELLSAKKQKQEAYARIKFEVSRGIQIEIDQVGEAISLAHGV